MPDKLKFLTNVPEEVTFKFDSPKVWDNTSQDGKAYKTYSYLVVNRGVDKYMSATQYLNDLLSQLGGLRDRTLSIEQVQDPADLKKKYWVIKENGMEVTPSKSTQSVTPTQQTNHQGCNCEETFENMRTAFKAMKDKVANLEALVSLVAGEDATDLHTTIPPKAKIDTVPWTERLATEHQNDNMSPSA